MRTDSALLVRLIVVCSLATHTAREPERQDDAAGRCLSKLLIGRGKKNTGRGPWPVPPTSVLHRN